MMSAAKSNRHGRPVVAYVPAVDEHERSAPSVVFNEPGDKFTGALVSWDEEPETDFETREPVTNRAGEQRTMSVLRLVAITAEGNPTASGEPVEPLEEYSLWLRGYRRNAYLKAWYRYSPDGMAALAGDVIAVKFVAARQLPRGGVMKMFSFNIEAPQQPQHAAVRKAIVKASETNDNEPF